MADVSATNAALFEYNEAMKAFMHAYKFIGDCRMAAVFQPSVTAAIMTLHPDVVVPMPVAQSTLVKRGFNQATLLLPSSVPVVSALRVQTVTKVQQSRLGRTARLARTQPFELDGQAGRKLTGQQVLIFDDVYTTGRTMRFAMQVLQDAGPKSLTGLTLAR
ncbi:ComF family protein [Furfurilactobacillus sp. WILCCON 0119]